MLATRLSIRGKRLHMCPRPPKRWASLGAGYESPSQVPAFDASWHPPVSSPHAPPLLAPGLSVSALSSLQLLVVAFSPTCISLPMSLASASLSL